MLGTKVAALATVLSLGWWWFPPHDAGPFDEPAPRTPEKFAEGVITTDAFEWRITFTPDGRTAYFPRSEGFFPITREATILTSRYVDGEWTEPEVASFSGENPDLDPFVSPDGVDPSTSPRSVRWTARSVPTPTCGWCAGSATGAGARPEHMGDVNSEADELYSSVNTAADELHPLADPSLGWGVGVVPVRQDEVDSSVDPRGGGSDPMIGRLDTVVLEARDAPGLARFYSELLGLPVTRADGDWVDIGDQATTRLSFQHAPEHEPPRWPDPASSMQFHLDIEVDDIEEAEPRVLALGATRLPWGSAEEVAQGLRPDGPTGFRVYADPAGHVFCLTWG